MELGAQTRVIAFAATAFASACGAASDVSADTDSPAATTSEVPTANTDDGPDLPTSADTTTDRPEDDTSSNESAETDECNPTPPTIPDGLHVAPDGSPSGDGSAAAPWDLQTALAHPKSLPAGSILYLHGGVYEGAFSSQLAGTADMPIVVRSFPGEWATIDGAIANATTTFEVNGSDTVYRDFEITNTEPSRFGGRAPGLNVYGPGVEIVNLVIHDGGGNGFWTPAVDATMYGNIVYHNGYDDDDRPHGHGIYTQNAEGTKEIANNIVFGNYSFGIHGYGQGGALVGFDFVDNVLFGASMAAAGTDEIKDNFLLGGTELPSARILLRGNVGYAPGPDHRSVRLGYGAPVDDDVTLLDNDLIGQTLFSTPWTTVEVSGNRFYGSVVGIDTAGYPDNEFDAVAPQPVVFVRPNRYEEGRAHVAVYNPGMQASVDVDLSAAVPERAIVTIRNAQDYFGDIVFEGEVDAEVVTLPMEGLTAVQPVGNDAGVDPSEQTGPAFQVFVVESVPCAP